MQTTPVRKLPYLTGTDLARDIPKQSQRIALELERLVESGELDGKPGAQGLPGLNGVPTDDAVAIYVDTPGTKISNAIKRLLEKFRGRHLAHNPLDYGAKGNGLHDDSPAVQAAINAIKAEGGGRLYFPAGDFWMPTAVFLCDNLEIYGHPEATLIKKQSSDPSYCIFVGSSGSSKGYGAGPSNIYLHDLSFRGKFGADGRGLCVMGLNHSDHVRVERIKVSEASSGGHRFDLQGCRYFRITDSVFYGFDQNQSGTYNEDIQADYSTRRSGSFLEADVSCYDGLPSQYITVDHCTWLPLVKPGQTWPAANPFGTHGTIRDVFIKGLNFTNNLVIGAVNDPKNVVPATLHFLAVQDLVIEGNVIMGRNDNQAPAIALYQSTGGQDPNLPHTMDPSISYTTPMRWSNARISRNYVSGHHAAGSVIQAKGSSARRAMDLVIEGNTIEKTSASNGEENTGPITMEISHVERYRIDGNTVMQSRRFAELSYCVDGRFVNNLGIALSINALTVANCTRLIVSGNSQPWAKAYGIYAYGSTGLSIVANTITGGSSPQIRVGDSRQFVVSSNILTGFSGSSKGVEITGTSNGVVLGNSTSGLSTPISPATTTGGIQVGYNAE